MPQPQQYAYRPEIDGLRAFAVIAVIINHFNKDLLPSGYLA
jgi:peptidoglycan/LPS O-acetylase OafA/YrhL